MFKFEIHKYLDVQFLAVAVNCWSNHVRILNHVIALESAETDGRKCDASSVAS